MIAYDSRYRDFIKTWVRIACHFDHQVARRIIRRVIARMI